MSDIKLDPIEQELYNEVGSRGDYFREAIQDRAAQQVNETGRRSEITTEAGNLVDSLPAPDSASLGDNVNDVVPPSDFSPVAGSAPGTETENPSWGKENS